MKTDITVIDSGPHSTHHRQAKKSQMKNAIIQLLRTAGPMEPIAITQKMALFSEFTVRRYLEELLADGHIRKVRAQGKTKNISAYEYVSDARSKTDIVSCALSHPWHQITLCFVEKRGLSKDLDCQDPA